MFSVNTTMKCLSILMFLFASRECRTESATNQRFLRSAYGPPEWSLHQKIANLDEKLHQLKHSMELIHHKLHDLKGGTSYTHWGRTRCTGVNAETIYSGFIGGSYHFGGSGAAPNKLCLPNQPQWGIYDNKVNNMPYIGATMIDNYDIDIKGTLFDKINSYYRLECAACLTKRSTTVMIPGRKECYFGWKKEYTGYLLAGHPTHKAASEYICIDQNPDFLKKSPSANFKSFLYAVYSKCNGATPCPPYVEGREMVCVVCSK